MSIILDALNRSRQDTEQVPGLATQHYDAYSDDDPRRSIRSYLPWFALLLAVAIIAWLLVDRNAGDPAPKPTPPATRTPEAGPDNRVSASQPAPQKPAPQKPVAQPATGAAPATSPVRAAPPKPVESAAAKGLQDNGPREAQSSKAVANLYDTKQRDTSAASQDRGDAENRMARASETKPGQESMPPQAPVVKEGVVGENTGARQSSNKEIGSAASKTASQQLVEEQPIDIEKMVLKARDDLENARLEEHSAPFITELSQQAKDDIPTIFYERHDYSGKPGQSAVNLNGKTLKEGGRLGAGLKVMEILSDSVVLEYRGTQFRLRALNSWINL